MDTEDTGDQIESQVEAPVSEGTGEVPQASPEPQQSSPWDAFKRLPEFQGQDDRSIAGRLYNAMEREKAASRNLAQYQQYMPYAQEYLQHRPQFQEYLKWRETQQAQPQQPPPQQQQAQQAQKWWNPPQVRDSYKRYLIKDESGREVIDPNAPLDAQHSLYEYMEYKANFARQFLEDPEKTLGPMVQELAAKQAQELIQERFSEVEQQHTVEQIQEQNKDWIFDPETGDVTLEGALVHKYIEQSRDLGISGPQARWEYAVAMSERELLARRFDEEQQEKLLRQQAEQFLDQHLTQPAQQPVSQPEPPQPPRPTDTAQQNMQYLRREASRNPSRSAGAANPDPRAPKPKMTFEQMLKAEASNRGLI